MIFFKVKIKPTAEVSVKTTTRNQRAEPEQHSHWHWWHWRPVPPKKVLSCGASNELLVVDILGKLSGITAKVLSCQRKEDSGNSQKLKHKVQGNPTTVVNTHLPISTNNNWWTKIINIKCAATYATLSCYCFKTLNPEETKI